MSTQINDKPRGRDAQRLLTRQRVYEAAVAEFKRSGVADAAIGEIIAAAGVARGTFYFHFPTKEHVLEEVERDLVARLATDLSRFLASSPDLWSALHEIVRVVVAGETRLRRRLFRDVLALHFSQTRPTGFGTASDHPLIALLAQEIDRARDAGLVHPEIDAAKSALFFLLGVYSLLVTNHDPKPARARLLDEFVANTRRALEAPQRGINAPINR
jgi:AcrR family transcriptional regulator